MAALQWREQAGGSGTLSQAVPGRGRAGETPRGLCSSPHLSKDFLLRNAEAFPTVSFLLPLLGEGKGCRVGADEALTRR